MALRVAPVKQVRALERVAVSVGDLRLLLLLLLTGLLQVRRARPLHEH